MRYRHTEALLEEMGAALESAALVGEMRVLTDKKAQGLLFRFRRWKTVRDDCDRGEQSLEAMETKY